ncbi:MAG: DUF1593 domain-containing protein, partial [Planctomycetes bacterium]|nr:DUF1593 domain-containing protein [Planctomycetota bacterium]
NATFEDRRRDDFDPDANTDAFLAQLPDYVAHGVRGFTLCLQGGMPGYEGALNSAFEADGSLRDSYLRRVQRVIEACDRHGAVVILGCYYQRQDQVLKDDAAVRAGVVNVARWIERSGSTNVVLEIANEFGHGGFDHRLLKTADGITELIRLAKATAPTLLVSASGLGGGGLPDNVAQASDFLLIHFNNTRIDDIPARIDAVRKYGKVIVCNEDVKVGKEGARAAELCVENGASWGLMLAEVNQHYPFKFQGAADDPEVYAAIKRLTSSGSVRSPGGGLRGEPDAQRRSAPRPPSNRGQDARDTQGQDALATGLGDDPADASDAIAKLRLTLPPNAGNDRLRLIIETDAGGDPDDEQSLVRFLLYANEWDIEGIIANRSATRRPENENPEDSGLAIVRRLLDAYGRCHPNLVRHDPRYPTKEVLWQRTVPGYNSTDEAVNLIIAAVDTDDPRPLWYSDWGTDRGAATNNLKRALDRVLHERGPEGYAKFKSKLRLSSYNQFDEHTTSIEPPFAIWIDTFQPPVEGKRWYHRFSALTAKAGGFDLVRDVLTNGGPLGALYPTNTGLWGKEGDTMTFLYLVPTGMNDPNEPLWGSWAGRYGLNESFPGKRYYWANQTDTWNGTTHRDNTLARWAADLQNDFRARLAWCVKPLREANHTPRAVVNGGEGKEILRITARPGQEVSLDARLSRDPDGDPLTYEWFVYRETGTYEGEAALTDASAPLALLRVPADAAGKTIHVILTVRDNGTPPLAAYRRVVVQVSSESPWRGRPALAWRGHPGLALRDEGVPPSNQGQDALATQGQDALATMGDSEAIPDGMNRGVELGPIRSLGPGITPGVATDSYGGVHIVYMNAGRILYVQADAAGTLRDPQEIPAPEGEAVYNSPHLVLDPEDVPHLVFERDFTSKSKKVWYTNRRQGAWKPPIEAIHAPEQRANYPRLAVTEDVALVGAFSPGDGFSGTLAKIVDLDTTPRVAAAATTALWVPTPFVVGDGWIVLGRAGPAGHMLQKYGPDLKPAGNMQKISVGTPSKTGEPIAGLRDAKGVVHAAGITGQAVEDGHRDWLWYNNSARMSAGQGAILGPMFSAGVSEYVYPSMIQDSAGQLYLAYRDFDTGEGKLVTVSPQGFGSPISIAPSATRRLRWNPQIAPGPDGRIYAVWDDNDTIHFRAIRVGEKGTFSFSTHDPAGGPEATEEAEC